MRPIQKNNGLPPKQGLYDPAFEHDACGVGFVVNMRGEKSHQIVRSGLEILVNLTHRGACGCDPLTGDGAGILTQIPHEFFASQGGRAGNSTSRTRATTASAPSFCRRDDAERQLLRSSGSKRSWPKKGRYFWAGATCRSTTACWARRPATSSRSFARCSSPAATTRRPTCSNGSCTSFASGTKLDISDSDLSQKKYCYVPSLSSRVIVYKGLLLADQVERFYADLADERFVSALALVHQRYSTNTFPTWDLAHPFRYLAHNGEINTLRGNVNWMHARESMFASEKYGPDLKKICPVCIAGRQRLGHVRQRAGTVGAHRPFAAARPCRCSFPSRGQDHESMPDELKAYYEYQACLMEPWDGPASMAFTDGTRDRRGAWIATACGPAAIGSRRAAWS